MNRNRKKIIESVYVPEDLQQFLSWEIRKIDGETLNVIKGKKQSPRATLTSEKGRRLERNGKK